MDREIEIKIKVDDIHRDIQKIHHLGATCINDFEFEDNLIFDFKEGTLKKRGTVLRIREYGGKHTITAKKKSKEEHGGSAPYKIRSEAETEVSDPASLREIFQCLGLRIVYRYQKYRAQYRLGDLSICCDRTPIGDFLELEGNRKDIDEVASRLGYNQEDYIHVSYLTYHRMYLQSKGLPSGDMLFQDKK